MYYTLNSALSVLHGKGSEAFFSISCVIYRSLSIVGQIRIMPIDTILELSGKADISLLHCAMIVIEKVTTHPRLGATRIGGRSISTKPEEGSLVLIT